MRQLLYDYIIFTIFISNMLSVLRLKLSDTCSTIEGVMGLQVCSVFMLGLLDCLMELFLSLESNSGFSFENRLAVLVGESHIHGSRSRSSIIEIFGRGGYCLAEVLCSEVGSLL
jgi:hypothetical protein